MGGGHNLHSQKPHRQGSSVGNETMEKKIKIAGRIGNTEYQNNDSGKVLYGGVYRSVYALGITKAARW